MRLNFPLIAVIAILSCLPAHAEKFSVKQGIAEFDKGRYKTAVSHFGALMNTEFNNPVLHYYLANSYVHLGKRDACIREYRIAYALEPLGDVGEMARQALVTLGVGTFDESKKPASTKKQPEKQEPDPDLIKALESLNKQSGISRIPRMKHSSQYKRIVRKTESGILKGLVNSEKGSVKLPGKLERKLETLRKLYAMKEKPQYGPRGTVQQSASNLKHLLKDRRSSHRLIPQGTNLYVRNYSTVKSKKTEKKPVQTPAKKRGSTQSPAGATGAKTQ